MTSNSNPFSSPNSTLAAMNREYSITEILDIVSNAQRVHVFTGAGMSAESGLQTYRNDATGLWENVDPQAMASISAWAKDPEPMWAWYLWRAHIAAQAQPNAGHRALAQWAPLVDDFHITTQNIDDLHERAGSTSVSHLHGSLFQFRCSICAKPYSLTEFPSEPATRRTPPTCSLCGNLIRPGVVWFGEPLPQKEWTLAEEKMATADVVVIVGTSGVVQPAASLPLIAAELGIPILEISPAETELSRWCTRSWKTTAATGLAAIVSELSTGDI